MRSRLALALVIAAACSDDEPVKTPSPCVPPARTVSGFVLEPAFPDASFTQPVEMIPGPGDRFYVLEQTGVVKVMGRTGAPTIALDLHDKIVVGGEAGLLGIAFDPDFATNGFVYLYFTAELEKKPDTIFQDVVARFESKDGGVTFDASTQTVILAVDDFATNHNGGHIAFGPDKMLYVAIGDGGNEGDPKGNGQNKDVLFGKILRIQPRQAGGDGGSPPYTIPSDNPFAGGGGRGEIWAYGLRNPWKFSFDKTTGELWTADVGQNKFEEIDRIEKGKNYGWNTREGAHCFLDPNCSADGLTDPIAEYGRTDGSTVVGGYVYRGTKLPSLAGKFVYGDFGNGNAWAVTPFGQSTVQKLLTSELKISGWAQDEDGELYALDYVTGKIGHLAAAPPGAVATGAGSSLIETGCYDPSGAIRYVPASPLWSDGATKERWVFPKGKIGASADGDFDLPPGSTAVKTFIIGGKKVETRLFVHHDDGVWSGFSYEWNDAQTDATLLDSNKTKDLGNGQSWYYPSRSECLECHTAAAGFTLGLEVRQLNHDGILERFAPVLASPAPNLPVLAAADSPNRSNEERARGYLHANCSMCHREGGGTPSMDLRIDQATARIGACNADPKVGDLGVTGAKLIFPGDPARSLMSVRMHALDEKRMPPLATHVVDDVGTNAVDTWIRELSCP